eukprot:m.142327 g.142327  ORF g.142327 m.142327 type:complete len:123 (+) comp22915_c1_seq2:65-433(+)
MSCGPSSAYCARESTVQVQCNLEFHRTNRQSHKQPTPMHALVGAVRCSAYSNSIPRQGSATSQRDKGSGLETRVVFGHSIMTRSFHYHPLYTKKQECIPRPHDSVHSSSAIVASTLTTSARF